MLVGPFAGSIREVKPWVAQEMIARKDALDPNMPISTEVPASPVVQTPVAIPSALPPLTAPIAGNAGKTRSRRA